MLWWKSWTIRLLDYIKLLDIGLWEFWNWKNSKTIETLRNMDRNNEDVISNLNLMLKKLIELNKKT